MSSNLDTLRTAIRQAAADLVALDVALGTLTADDLPQDAVSKALVEVDKIRDRLEGIADRLGGSVDPARVRLPLIVDVEEAIQ